MSYRAAFTTIKYSRSALASLGAFAMLLAGHAHAESSPLGPKPPARASLLKLNDGDRGCYLDIQDAKGKKLQPIGDFELCQSAKNSVGYLVDIAYSKEKVQSVSCEGREDCKATDTVWLATRISKAPAPSGSLCQPGELEVFSCKTAPTKSISVCSQGAATPGARAALRFSSGAQPPSVAVSALSGGNAAYSGGGASWLRIPAFGKSYTAYSGVGKWGANGAILAKDGIEVSAPAGKPINLSCMGPSRGELGPEWLDAFKIRRDKQEFSIPE